MIQQTSEKTPKQHHHSAHFKDPFVEVTKKINAPVQDVWKAWSDPKLIKQWWGPKGFVCPMAKVEFKIDGHYHFAMTDPDGNTMWSTGTYLEIFPYKLIVCTDQFADEKGNPITPKEAGMGPLWDSNEDTLIFSVKFIPLSENTTELQLVHEGIPATMHDSCIDGWGTSLDKMKEMLERSYLIT